MQNVKNCQNDLGTNDKIDSINSILVDSFDHPNKMIATRILNILKESDFEVDFYKMRILLMMDNFAPQLEKTDFTDTVPDTTEFLDIYLDRNNRIFLEGKVIDEDILDTELRKYFGNENLKNEIRFFSSKKSNYGAYTSLFNAIKNSFIDSRNNFSKREYGANYQELDSIQKLIIDNSFPKHIIE